MKKGVWITPEQRELAANADILTVVQGLGHSILRVSGKEYCLEEHDSLKISNNKWCWNSREGTGGNPIDFLMKYHNYSFQDAVIKILEITNTYHEKSDYKRYEVPKFEGVFDKAIPESEIPKQHINNNRVIAYLTKSRGIDYNIVKDLINRGLLYEADKTHNAVFLRPDESGVIKYIMQRGTLTNKRFVNEPYQSDKRFSFLLAYDVENKNHEKLYVYESIIDALSHATIDKLYFKDYKAAVRLATGGTNRAGIKYYLQSHPDVKELVICFDNDTGGRNMAKKVQDEFPDYKITNCMPKSKDYSDELLYLMRMASIER